MAGFTIRIAAFLAVVLLAGAARADDQPPPQQAGGDKAQTTERKENGVRIIQEADKVVVRKRTVIDFGDVTVEGELTKPEGSYLLNRKQTRFQSLIKLRKDFNPELQKSADNL
jgi:hypothetical protein